ncbi:MAG: hypothetical protein CME33_15430 [Gimesia sp.]|uniref:hypothetical protein n=1 Tax=Gimesia sp. TaxID=2024833 RepID=UPI000C643307|nr:hypothetical protein [Gimesia sp.]MAX37946.1 hypothetical protein [Gimesia sp.]|tara:strand:- start:8330 stop:8629 length:300 start_codon:yes stop_codon:yes gene_type:complete
MSSQAQVLRDGIIEIQTGDDDYLILTMDEARTFQIEINHTLLSIYSEDQADLENQNPIVVNDVFLSIEDAEQLASKLDVLLSNESREPEQRIDWIRVGY